MAKRIRQWIGGRFVFAVLLLAIFSGISFAETNWCLEYGKKGEYDKAIEACTAAIKSGRNSKWMLQDLYHNRGTAHAGKGNYDRAISDFNQAIKLDSTHGAAYAERGRTYHDKGNYDKAISDLNKALQLEPNDCFLTPYILLNRGNTYAQKASYDRAIDDYNKALHINPRESTVYVNRGIAYTKKGDYDRAICDYDQAISLDPKAPQQYAAKATTLYLRDDYMAALECSETAIKLGLDDERFYLMALLASRKVLKERAQDRLNKLRTYVKVNRSTESVRTISKYYLGMDGLTEKRVIARAHLPKDAIEKRFRLCETYYYLGEDRLWKGDKEGARQFFTKSIETKEHRLLEYHLSWGMLKQIQNTEKR